MDFAIIETGGKQYKITPESILNVEHLASETGSKVVFDKVLMVVDGDDVKIGTPYLENTSFEAVIEDHIRGKKIRILRYHHKSRWRKHKGHRQELTTVNFSGKTSAKAKKETKAEKTEVASEKTVPAVKTEAKTEKKVVAKSTKKAPAKKAAAKTAKTAKKAE